MAQIILAKAKDFKKEDINEFKMCGVIVRKFLNEKSACIILRLTTHRGRGAITNYPRIHFYTEEAVDMVKNLTIYDKVVVEGYVSSFKEQKPGFPPQSFVGTNAYSSKQYLAEHLGKDEDDVLGDMYEDINEVTIKGTVEKAYFGSGGNLNLEIITFHDEVYMKRIRVTMFIKEDENPCALIIPGSRVLVTGRCSTVNKPNREGKNIHYESIIANTITSA